MTKMNQNQDDNDDGNGVGAEHAAGEPLPSAKKEANAFDATVQKGAPDGLFRACMASIRAAHFKANKLRAALVFAGLLTDVRIYAHSLSMFYVVTREVEHKILNDEKFLSSLTQDEREIISKLGSMGFSFTPGYEKDLQVLYEEILYPKSIFSWKEHVEQIVESTAIVKEYQRHIRSMSKASEVAGAAFVLWGALIIGGGAMIQPKAKRIVGPNAVNVFESVIGPNRESRRQLFIKTWDSLAPKESMAAFEIKESTKQCMQYNNDMMGSGSKANPWWFKYVILLIILFLGCVLYLIYESKISSPVVSMSELGARVKTEL
jgi:hypothetical protein